MKSFASLVALSSLTIFKPVLSRSFDTRQTNIATTPPTNDPFYAQPANIASYQPGDIIDSRPVTTVILGNFANTRQIKYRTNDRQGNAISTIGTLWIPNFPSNPPRIISYQYAEDALNLDCSPSWAWVQGTRSTNANITTLEGNVVIPPSLRKGYYVIQPDAEGPASSWLVGKTEGQSVLDGIRATIKFNNLAVANTQIGMYGYSGAAHSTVWAASLAETYAPELKIRGAAFGGTPIDLAAAYQTLNGGDEALLAGGALFGLAQGYPELETNFQTSPDGLTAEGKQVAQTVRGPNFCITFQATRFADVNFNQYFNTAPLSNPVFVNIVNQESLLMNVSTIPVPVPKFPRFQYHGTADVTVPYWPEAAYVQQQCANGANIQFQYYTGFNHSAAAVFGIGPALNFLDQAFSGTTPNCVCGTTCAF